MKKMDDVVTFTKNLLAKYGRLEPTILLEGTAGGDARPLPDAPEPIKLALLEAIGYSLADTRAIGELTQLFLIAEGWASSAPYQPGVPATQPKHDPNRIEVVMIFRYDAGTGDKQMRVYRA